jgi:transcriptional regulator with XRE-family HTH domain
MPEDEDRSIQNLLSSYDLGHKLRRLRFKKKISLVDLGKHTGLSASMLSQLETGKMVPTLPTLARIAMVFDVGLEHFFDLRSQEKLFSIVRAKERLKFPESPDSPLPSYYFECLAFATRGKELGAYWAEFPVRSEEEATEHKHEGGEFLFILEGSIVIRYQDKDYVLETGDSVYFDASDPHSYRGLGENGAKAIVLTTPPRV